MAKRLVLILLVIGSACFEAAPVVVQDSSRRSLPNHSTVLSLMYKESKHLQTGVSSVEHVPNESKLSYSGFKTKHSDVVHMQFVSKESVDKRVKPSGVNFKDGHVVNSVDQRTVDNITQSILKEYALSGTTERLGIAWKCDICIGMVKLIQVLSEVNKTKDEIAALVMKECIALKLQDSRVCQGIVPLFKPEVLTVLSAIVLQPAEVCGHVFGSLCAAPYNPDQMWTVPLPDVQKPPVKTPPTPQLGSPTLRVLHLSDIHIDTQYTVNSSVDCGEPICCRKEDGIVKSGGAPHWGSYNDCDMPKWTLENLFQHLAQSEKFDYIVFTGDIPAHYVWESSHRDTATQMHYLTALFLKYFPGIPVYNSLGNHEGVPVNSFPPPWKVVPVTERSDWLYMNATETWGHWLPNDTFTTIRRGGFYTTLIKPGLRIVSLNMNFANSKNWWLLINMTDPVGQLSWLVGVLQQAETKGEKVQIIGHIPPGLCTKPWSWAFYEIVNRYESTIVGQFYGHTHIDEYEIFYDPETNLTRPTSVAYIGPSVEAGSSGNNGYRIYTIDGQRENTTWQVLDHETHVMNLSEANAGKAPSWFKSYSAKTAYNMSSLLPEDWDHLVQRMDTEDQLFQMYYRNTHKLHDVGRCDEGCRKNTLCGIKSARPDDPQLCHGLNLTHIEHQAWREATSLC